jgi:hypothetical protein
MMTAVKGVYRNGKVELSENPGVAAEGSPVIVTFLPTGVSDLQSEHSGEDPTIQLFREWQAEDATDEPAELADREESLEEFLVNLRADRLRLRIPKI